MMTLLFNNTSVTVEEFLSLKTFLKEVANLQGEEGYAVMVNQQFVPKARHESTVLNAGDAIQLITPMQGG